MSQDPLAGILAEAEANRRRDRAASAAAVTTSVPAAEGNFTVSNTGAGNQVTLDARGKVPQDQLYPAGIGQTGVTFEFVQAVPARVWTVRHDLNGFPNVVVRDDRGTQVIAEISASDRNTTEIRFGRPTAGTADLSL